MNSQRPGADIVLNEGRESIYKNREGMSLTGQLHRAPEDMPKMKYRGKYNILQLFCLRSLTIWLSCGPPLPPSLVFVIYYFM